MLRFTGVLLLKKIDNTMKGASGMMPTVRRINEATADYKKLLRKGWEILFKIAFPGINGAADAFIVKYPHKQHLHCLRNSSYFLW